MDAATTRYKIRRCSKCPGDAVYICVSCKCSMCPQCTEKHATDDLTIDHTVVIYGEKFNQEQEIYVRDPNNTRKEYERKRQQHIGTILVSINEALFNRDICLTEIKTDIKTCQLKFSRFQSGLSSFGQKLKNRIGNSLRKFDFRHGCLRQKIKMSRRIASIQNYIQVYEQSAYMPVQFLVLKKITHHPPVHLSLHTSQVCITGSLNEENLIELLSRIQIKERGRRRVRNKEMPGPELYTVKGVRDCCCKICTDALTNCHTS